MIGLWIKAALGMVGLLTGLLGLVRYLPRPESPLAALVAPPPGCAVPCWMGIRPNQTRYEDALVLLQADPHIVTLDASEAVYAKSQHYIWYIFWTWSDGDQVNGYVAIQNGVVRLIRVRQRIPLGLVWVLLGQPQESSFVGTLTYRTNQPTTVPLYQVGLYLDDGVTAQTDATCDRLWLQPTMLTIGTVSPTGHAYDLAAFRHFACQESTASCCA